nr:MAG: RNA-dependent RNA polymerase [Riboviria sp.]
MRATRSACVSLAQQPLTRYTSLFAAIACLPSALAGSVTAGLGSAFSLLSFVFDPAATGFSTRSAAIYNLHSLLNLRQFLRFLLFASILLIAYTIGGSAMTAILQLFHKRNVVETHASRSDTVLSIIMSLLVSWLTLSFPRNYVTAFLKSSALLGATIPVMSTLYDAILWLLKVIGDIAISHGFNAVGETLSAPARQKTLASLLRKGGPLATLVPSVTSFLSERAIGSTGPGTATYVTTGRSLLAQLDDLLATCVQCDGAGLLVTQISRYRSQVSDALNASLFMSSNSESRVEPYSLLILGAPRIGKTFFTNSLILALRLRYANLQTTGPELHLCNLAKENRWCYSRNASDEFFSGYNRQPLIFYDDAFTCNNALSRDKAAEKHEKDLHEIQSLCSSQPYAPPMPEVGAGVPCPKGTLISPAFVIMTSNYLFVKTTPRPNDVIDDRINMVLLALPTGEPKDDTFNHIRFFTNTARLSEIRAAATAEPSEEFPEEHHYPHTLEEFERWPLARFFEEITIPQIVDRLAEGHLQRLLEQQNRIIAARRIANAQIFTDAQNELEHSLSRVLAAHGFALPADFQARVMAHGLRRAIRCSQSLQPGRSLVDDPAGNVRFHLRDGNFSPELAEHETNCTCPDPHTCIYLCPQFRQLVLNFSFSVRARDATPAPPLPLIVRVGDHFVQNRPTMEQHHQEVLASLAEMLNTRAVADEPVFDPLVEVPDNDDPLLIAGFEEGNFIGYGYLPPHADRATVFPANFEQRGVTRANVRRVNELHAINLLRAVNDSEPSRRIQSIYETFFPHLRVVAPPEPLPHQISSSQVASLIARNRAQEHPPTPNDIELRRIFATVLNPQPLDDVSRRAALPNLHADVLDIPFQIQPVSQPSIDLATQRIAELQTVLMRVAPQWDAAAYFTLEEQSVIEYISASEPDHGRFYWRVMSRIFHLAHLGLYVAPPTITWEFRNPETGLASPLPFETATVLSVTAEKYLLTRTVHQPLNRRLDTEDFIRKLLLDTPAEIRCVGNLCRIAHECQVAEPPTLAQRLRDALGWLADLVRRYWRPLMTGLAVAAGTIALATIPALLWKFVRPEEKVEEHAVGAHFFRIKNASAWPAHFYPLLASCFHPATSEKFCKQCSRLNSAVSLSYFNAEKMVAILRGIANCRAVPAAKRRAHLKAIHDQNLEFVSLIRANLSPQALQQKLLNMATGHRLVITHRGTGLHVSVYATAFCRSYRERALQALQAQIDFVQRYLGSQLASTYPSYAYIPELPQTSSLPSPEFRPCCLEPALCVCPETTDTITEVEENSSGMEKAVAAVISQSNVLEVGVSSCIGTLVSHGVIAFPYHAIKNQVADTYRVVWHGQEPFATDLRKDAFHTLPERDLAFVQVPSTELPARHLTSYLLESHPGPGSRCGVLVRRNGVVQVADAVIVPNSREKLEEPYNNTKNFMVMDWTGRAGDSGSPVVMGSKIIGHYVGVGASRGMIAFWPKSLTQTVRPLARSDLIDSRAAPEITPEGFAVIEHIDTSVFDSVPPTDLRKSPLSTALEVENHPSVKAPARLNQDALKLAFSKFSRFNETFDAAYAASAAELGLHLKTAMDAMGLDCTPFSNVDQALNGKRDPCGPRLLKRVDMSTSAGPPYSDKGVTKDQLINRSTNDQWLTATPELSAAVSEVESSLESGDVATPLCSANLKDELRDIPRVRAGKTRLFCAMPLHVNLVYRKHLGPWISAYKRLPRAVSFHAMGTDVYGHDWDTLAELFHDFGDHRPGLTDCEFMACDFSRFDTSHSPWKIMECFKAIGVSSGQEDWAQRLGQAFCRFETRYDGRRFRVPRGLPSGGQMTTPLNCLLNTTFWLTIWRKTTGLGLVQFRKHCRLLVYGDDVVLAMKKNDSLKNAMSPEAISRLALELGYEVGSADDGPMRWQSFHEITFLKRRFAQYPHSTLVHAPRPLDEVWTQLHWQRKPRLSDDEVSAVLTCFAYEIAQFPPDTQRAAYRSLTRACRSCSDPRYLRSLIDINFLALLHTAYEKERSLESVCARALEFYLLW